MRGWEDFSSVNVALNTLPCWNTVNHKTQVHAGFVNQVYNVMRGWRIQKKCPQTNKNLETENTLIPRQLNMNTD